MMMMMLMMIIMIKIIIIIIMKFVVWKGLRTLIPTQHLHEHDTRDSENTLAEFSIFLLHENSSYGTNLRVESITCAY